MDNRKIILAALQYFQAATEAIRSGAMLLNEIIAGYDADDDIAKYRQSLFVPLFPDTPFDKKQGEKNEQEADKANQNLQEATSNVYGNGHTSLYADMIDAIEHDRQPYVDAVAGRNALEMVLAIYKSQKDGVPVKLPLKHFKSTDMAGEFDA